MNRSETPLPLKRLAGWAFVLNTMWEFGQCVFLFDMWDWPFWKATLYMWAAVAGDVLIVLGVVWMARRLAPRVVPPDARGWGALLFVGACAALVLEWAALALDLWSYSALMPTVQVAGHAVGLSPLVQITTLPAFSAWLAGRASR